MLSRSGCIRFREKLYQFEFDDKLDNDRFRRRFYDCIAHYFQGYAISF